MGHFDIGYWVMNYLVSGVAFLAIAVAVGLVAYGIAWLLFNRSYYSPEQTVTAKVLTTSFKPERTHTGVGFGNVGGHMGTMIVTETEEEEDIVLLRSQETGRIQIDNAKLLDVVEKGEEVQLSYRRKYTYWVWNSSKKTLNDYVPTLVVTKSGESIKV